MTGFVAAIAALIRAIRQIATRKWTFLGVFAFVFVALLVMLAKLDLLPNPPKSPAAVALSPAVTLATGTVTTASTTTAEEPVRIVIPKIKTDVTVANPTTTDLAALDALLLKGAARYPTSAKLGQDGNVVIFGHSSYLPIVYNQAYKTFDGIQTLKQGDTIIVYSAGTAYTYAVQSVAKESTISGAGIDLSVAGKVLTLVTCNSFTGTETDRFVLTADFVESHSIPTAS